MKKLSLMLAGSALFAAHSLYAQDKNAVPSPNEIVDAAAVSEWKMIAASDLLVMDIAPDRDGNARRVIIQLMPAPFSQGHIGNIRKLASEHWWDGTAIVRVQDNYVTQWGDPTEKKPLPENLVTIGESEYSVPMSEDEVGKLAENAVGAALARMSIGFPEAGEGVIVDTDSYADIGIFVDGWPIGVDGDDAQKWPVHCYGAVGVGRNYSPDTGTGAELYTVIGHAPRHLDRNIALVGRIVEGMEHMSSLPRGKGVLGFYESEAERTPILSVRLASELPEAEQPHFEYLDTDGETFARYADARANRRDPFFLHPAGAADICNVPVPVRRHKAG